MKKYFLKLSLFLAAVLLIGTLAAGCGTSQEKPEAAATGTTAVTSGAVTAAPTPEPLKEVELNMYLLGNGAAGVNAVYEKVNEMAKKDINATVKVSYLANQDAYNLMLSSGEEFDIVAASDWLNYADNARKGAFKEITPEMLQKYIPEYAALPENVINSGKVDGKIYALPKESLQYNYMVYVVRGDLMKKYNIPDIKTLDDFGVYMEAVKKNEKGIIPLNMGKWDAWRLAAINFGINDLMAPGAPNCVSPIYIDKKDDTLKLQKTWENPEVIAFCKKMKEWREKGYWAKDSLSNPIALEDSFKNGKSAAMTYSYNGIDALDTQMKKEHPEWDVRFYSAYYQGYVDAYSTMTGGVAIGGKSRNPERALMLLNLMMYDQRYFDLVMYGIEGTNYTLSADKQISFPADNTYPGEQIAPWIGNSKLGYLLQGTNPELGLKFTKDAESRFKPNPTVDFALDTKDISDISTNISNLYLQYGMPLYMGFVDDVDQAVEKYKSKLEEAGLEKYIEATRTQLDAFLKTNQ